MKKKHIVTAGIVAVVLLIGSVSLYAGTRSKDAQPGTVAAAKQKAGKVPTPKCLIKNDSVKLEVADQQAIEADLVSQLIDVPAGTETQINYSTHVGPRVTGTEFYPKDYGTYNFIAEQGSDGWRVTSFIACKA